MLLDKQLEFSDSQAVTTTAISTNVVDLGPTNTLKDIGGPEAVYLIIQTDVAVTGATSVAFSLESSSTANLATTPTVHYSSAAIPVASLPASISVAVAPLPAGAYQRYMGIRYTVVGTATTGAFSAFLVRDAQAWRAYANAI